VAEFWGHWRHWQASGRAKAADTLSHSSKVSAPFVRRAPAVVRPGANGSRSSNGSTSECYVAQRRGEPVPPEVGYWLYEAATGEIHAAASSSRAGSPRWPVGRQRPTPPSSPPRRQGEANYTIGEKPLPGERGSTLSYDAPSHGDDTWSYDETTMLKMAEFAEPSPTPTQHLAPRRLTADGGITPGTRR